MRVQALVIGSGAGGATTALALAERGLDVLVLEEGEAHGIDDYGALAPVAMSRLYRQRGMTPLIGRPPIGFVEGCCLGGSTEINSGFWHRTPRETLMRWASRFELRDADPDTLAEHFDWSEDLLGVGMYPGEWPASTRVFRHAADAMGWSAAEIPRMAPGCRSTNRCASGCPTGAKRGMSRSVLPLARRAGARMATGYRVKLLLHRRGRVRGVIATVRHPDGSRELVRIDAEHVFVCAGAIGTAALLRRSGIKRHVGDSLRTHPMLKLVADFPDTIDAHASVLPLLQVKEFWPEISMGGGYFSPGHLAMGLADNWPENAPLMSRYRNMAMYYVAVRGTGRGTVRPAPLNEDGALVRYSLSQEDLRNLSRGLARLATMMLAAGARAVYPSVYGLPAIRSEVDAAGWLDDVLKPSRLTLSTVHTFSSCPIGENESRCAADSHGRMRGFENLYVNDASMLPDSPGVNPQGTIMALARRNAQRAAAEIA